LITYLNVYAYHGSADFEKQLVRHQSDAASWYHLVVQFDSTEGTNTNRIKLYINGVRYTDFETGTFLVGGENWPTLSEATDFGTTDTIKLGVNSTFGSPHAYFFFGEIAEVIMIDGAALDPTSFGEEDDDGFWMPIELSPANFPVTKITNAVPVMTGYTTPSGTVATDDDTNSPAWQAFNGVVTSPGNYWYGSGTTPNFITYEFTSNETVVEYGIWPQTGYAGSRYPTAWTLEGWTGSAWEVLDTRSGETSWTSSVSNDYTVASPDSYIKYKLDITAYTGLAIVQGIELRTAAIVNMGTNGFWLDFADTNEVTNTHTYSEDLSNAAFGKNAVTIATNSTAAPNGTITADSVIEDGTTGNHRTTSSFTGTAADYTYSFFAKRGTRNVAIETWDGTSTTYGYFDLTAGTVVAGQYGASAASATIENFGNGWYRCSITRTMAVASCSVAIQLMTDTYNISYAGDSASLAYIWGVQLEISSTLGVYVPTTTAAVTAAGLGKDVSKRIGNHFTGVSLSAASQIASTPTDNFATLNPLYWEGTTIATFSNNNLTAVTTNNTVALSTIGISSGKVYFELTQDAHTGAGNGGKVAFVAESRIEAGTQYGGHSAGLFSIYANNGNAYSGATDLGNFTTHSDGDTYGFAMDFDNDAVWVRKNGLWLNGATTGEVEAGTTTNAIWTGVLSEKMYPAVVCESWTNATHTANFGANAFDDAAPEGFLAISTANLPEPAIIDPSDHFSQQIVAKSGSTTDFTVPDWLTLYDWKCTIKNISGATEKWYVFDSFRGVTKYFSYDSNAVEATDANVFSFSGTTGTLGSTLTSGKSYLVEFHKAGLQSARNTNTTGSITVTTSVNLTSLFGMCHHSAGTAANATIGHDLGVAPKYIEVNALAKSANATEAYHVALGAGYN
jgi:hypothetical protein